MREMKETNENKITVSSIRDQAFLSIDEVRENELARIS